MWQVEDNYFISTESFIVANQVNEHWLLHLYTGFIPTIHQINQLLLSIATTSCIIAEGTFVTSFRRCWNQHSAIESI